MRSLAAGVILLALACARAPEPARQVEPHRVAGTIRVDTFWSQALGTRKQLLVYLPPSYARDPVRRFPVAYYLHGLWGNERNWRELGRLDATADSLAVIGAAEMIVIMPDGDDGWYTTWNSLGNFASCRERPPAKEPAATYCVPWPHYDDYIGRDLVAYVDSTYRTLPRREHRAIAGLSMGGYGAVTLALAYPEVFGAAASHSGVLAPLMLAAPGDTLDFPATMKAGAGALWPTLELVFGSDTSGWFARDPGRFALRAQSAGHPLPALYIDVGTSDRLLEQSRAFRALLEAAGIEHSYAEHSGGHDWTYWRTHAPASLEWLARRIAK